MSVAGAIADAAVAAVTGLSLTYGSPPVAFVVKRRKTPTLPQGIDPPQVVVTVGEEPDTEAATSKKDFKRYPLGVAIITATLGRNLKDDEAVRLIREQVHSTINRATTFAGVPQFNRIDPGRRDPFLPGALPKDVNLSTLLFSVEAIESRL